jgi:hypothetical protein
MAGADLLELFIKPEMEFIAGIQVEFVEALFIQKDATTRLYIEITSIKVANRLPRKGYFSDLSRLADNDLFELS